MFMENNPGLSSYFEHVFVFRMKCTQQGMNSNLYETTNSGFMI